MNQIDKNAYLTISKEIDKIQREFSDIQGVDKKLKIAIFNLKMIHSYYGYIPKELEIMVKDLVENIFWNQKKGRGYIHNIFIILGDICEKNRIRNQIIIL
jgi:hypothetical protein